jgi:hypothetical protein
MFSAQNLALLLWRLRRQPALYVFGAGTSAPVVQLTPALMHQAALDYVRLGSFPVESASRTPLTERMTRAERGINYYPDRELRPGLPGFPSDEILRRLSHGGIVASLMHYLSKPRFAGRRLANFTVLRAFCSSLIVNYNLDGLAVDACAGHHRVIDVHGSIQAGYGSPDGATIMRIAQEYGISMPDEGIVLCAPESFTDRELHKRLQTIQRYNPAFVMIVGYSFGKTEAGYDDSVSLEAFVGRFREMPIDVYVLEPDPFDLADMLGERLHSDRVHPFPIYWNLLAAAFSEALSERLSADRLEYFHEQLLDDHGPYLVTSR